MSEVHSILLSFHGDRDILRKDRVTTVLEDVQQVARDQVGPESRILQNQAQTFKVHAQRLVENPCPRLGPVIIGLV